MRRSSLPPSGVNVPTRGDAGNPLLRGLLGWLPWSGMLVALHFTTGSVVDPLWPSLAIIGLASVLLLFTLLRQLPALRGGADPGLWAWQAGSGTLIIAASLYVPAPESQLSLLLAALPWLAVHGRHLGLWAVAGMAFILLAAAAMAAGERLITPGLLTGLAAWMLAVLSLLLALGSPAGRLATRAAQQESGLPRVLDREGLIEVLDRERARARRQSGPLSVCLMDLDDLGRIHLERGQAAVDALNQAFGKVMLARIRQMDVIGRLQEGDEAIGPYSAQCWIAVLPGTGIAGAVSFANRIRHAVDQLPLRLDGERIRCSASAGVAEYRNGEPNGSLLTRAESALHRAQRLGSNRVERETAGEARVPPA